MDFDTEADTADRSNINEAILTDAGNGLLDGVGNEVWVGLFSTAALIAIVKVVLDKLFPSRRGNQMNSAGDAQSQTNNQGKMV